MDCVIQTAKNVRQPLGGVRYSARVTTSVPTILALNWDIPLQPYKNQTTFSHPLRCRADRSKAADISEFRQGLIWFTWQFPLSGEDQGEPLSMGSTPSTLAWAEVHLTLPDSPGIGCFRCCRCSQVKEVVPMPVAFFLPPFGGCCRPISTTPFPQKHHFSAAAGLKAAGPPTAKKSPGTNIPGLVCLDVLRIAQRAVTPSPARWSRRR